MRPLKLVLDSAYLSAVVHADEAREHACQSLRPQMPHVPMDASRSVADSVLGMSLLYFERRLHHGHPMIQSISLVSDSNHSHYG